MVDLVSIGSYNIRLLFQIKEYVSRWQTFIIQNIPFLWLWQTMYAYLSLLYSMLVVVTVTLFLSNHKTKTLSTLK